MAKTREIKRRIKSVDNTRQITKTMEMVAAAKIKRAQDRIEAARPYAFQMMEVLANLAEHTKQISHPLLEVREPAKRTVLVVITSDRGLCGAFNANILRRAEQLRAREEATGAEVAVVAIGRKALNYYRYVGTDLLTELVGVSDRPTFKDAQEVAEQLINLYTNKWTDKVVVLFNHFKSAMEQKAVEYTLLPIKKEIMAEKPVREVTSEYLYEPSDTAVLNRLLPTYIEAIVYRALLESAASEHGARRAAMKSATDNASEMIEVLTRSFNRARQAAITQEIAEIVGGAEALKNKEEKLV